MISFLYRALISPLLRGVIAAASRGSEKGRRGDAGRKGWRDQLASLEGRSDGELRVHFHAASVGEFEQAKPIIEALRARYRKLVVTASFFSPSGYEQQGSYAALDAASYLPRDTGREMRAFLDVIDPDLIVIIRYDLWPGFLLEARRRSIPVILACGVLRAGSSRFNPLLRSFFAWQYGMLTMIHAVGEEDRASFASLARGVPVVVSGDTRYDRVLARARATADLERFTPAVIDGRTVIVAGSTWPPDEELLLPIASRSDVLMVIVPHEPTPEHVAALLDRFTGAMTLSALERDVNAKPATIIVDRTGILSALYRIGEIAYVGGAFGEGVHSVLEPAAYGMPVLSGPKIERSRDAEELRKLGLLKIVRTPEELRDALGALIDDPAERERCGRAAGSFVASRAGATDAIIASLAAEGYIPAVEPR